MMDTPKAAPMREDVTQADREAAIAYRLYTSSLPSTDYRAARIRDTIGSGQWDDKESVQIFARHRLAHTGHPDAASCAALPDQADILETIENATDNWQANGYTSALAEVRDMANVGRSLMEALPKGYCYADSPAEIVTDLQNELDETRSARPDAGDADVEPTELAPEIPATPALREVVRLHFENVGGDEAMGKKAATIDSAVYHHTFYGILNKQGQFWTPLPFHDEAAARAHLAKWAIGKNQNMLDTHKIVPVRIRLTALSRKGG